MFLYALKSPLYAADHNEIASCSKCFRKNGVGQIIPNESQIKGLTA